MDVFGLDAVSCFPVVHTIIPFCVLRVSGALPSKAARGWSVALQQSPAGPIWVTPPASAGFRYDQE